MFTGIIETMGKVVAIDRNANTIFHIDSELGPTLKVDQSLSHNGVCLTVIGVEGNRHRVEAIDETLQKSNLGQLAAGDMVNLERCMLNNGRFDGHIVQGHVDQVGKVKSITDVDGSWLYVISYDEKLGNVTVEKGSISVNGVSLTCFNSKNGEFTVAIIPYTHEHTTFGSLRTGDTVNLEFDIIGKYVKRLLGRD
ncbi:MAG: riboflavin synthase [Chryseolinea sp.]